MQNTKFTIMKEQPHVLLKAFYVLLLKRNQKFVVPGEGGETISSKSRVQSPPSPNPSTLTPALRSPVSAERFAGRFMLANEGLVTEWSLDSKPHQNVILQRMLPD